jgi:hypothetical protein
MDIQSSTVPSDLKNKRIRNFKFIHASMNQHQLDTLPLVYFMKGQFLYMFRALLAHLQAALHSFYLV